MNLQQLTLYFAILALLLQSIENLSVSDFFPDSKTHKKMEWLILIFSLGLIATPWFAVPILVLFYLRLLKLQGPINGGSDTMITTVLFGILLNQITWIENLGLLYIGVNSFLSYLIPGLAKLRNINWLNGSAINTISNFSFYQIPNSVIQKLNRPKLAAFTSMAVVVFECSVILGPFIPNYILFFIPVAFAFHLINSYILGLHRFIWAWLASFPGLYCFVETIRLSI